MKTVRDLIEACRRSDDRQFVSQIGSAWTALMNLRVGDLRAADPQNECSHCGASLLPRRADPILCESCVAVCSDNCDHRWDDDHNLKQGYVPPEKTT